MTTAAELSYYGGALAATLTDGAMIDPRAARVHAIRILSGGATLSLPPATLLRTGGPRLVIINAGSFTFDVVAFGGGALVTLDPGDIAVCYLAGRATTAGEWRARKRAGTSGAAPIAASLGAVLGGTSGSGLAEALIINPQVGTWSSFPASPTPHVSGAGAGIGALGYIVASIGGIPAHNRALHAFAEASGSWATLAAAPADLGFSAAAADGTDFYVFGGPQFAGSPNFTKTWRYQPGSDAWDTRANQLDDRVQAHAQHISGEIYLAAGYTGAGGAPDQVMRHYTPGSDSWATLASLPSPARIDHSGFVLSGKVYIAGGWSGALGAAFDDVDEYTPGSDSWASVASLPAAGRFHGAGFAAGYGYYAGGNTDGLWTGRQSDVFRYSAGSWAVAQSLPLVRDLAANTGAGVANA